MRPPHSNNGAATPCENQLLWRPLPDSRLLTRHINRL